MDLRFLTIGLLCLILVFEASCVNIGGTKGGSLGTKGNSKVPPPPSKGSLNTNSKEGSQKSTSKDKDLVTSLPLRPSRQRQKEKNQQNQEFQQQLEEIQQQQQEQELETQQQQEEQQVQEPEEQKQSPPVKGDPLTYRPNRIGILKLEQQIGQQNEQSVLAKRPQLMQIIHPQSMNRDIRKQQSWSSPKTEPRLQQKMYVQNVRQVPNIYVDAGWE